MGLLQLYKPISNTDGFPIVWGPLGIVMAVSMIKDLMEDSKRHKADEQENKAACLTLQQGKFSSTT